MSAATPRKAKQMSKDQETNPNSEPALAGASGSAAVESANAWALLARTSTEKAMEAVARGHHGSAESYRKIADEAFEKEFRLRQQPNVKMTDAHLAKRSEHSRPSFS